MKNFTIQCLSVAIFVSAMIPLSAQVNAATTIVKKTAFILVDFPDNHTHYWTPTQAGDTLSRISSYYLENSYGNIALNGGPTDVYGYYTINRTCDILGISGQAKSAATTAGVDLSTYDLVVSVGLFNCGWSGADSAGSIVATPWEGGIAHEIGHALGLMSHANFYNCGTQTTGTLTCAYVEYGDPYSVLGGGSLVHMSAYEKTYLNVFQPSNVVNVSSDGTYSIVPIELATTSPQVLRISRSNGPLFIEYRKPIGFDSIVPSFMGDGALIRWGNNLLDMTPTVPASQSDPILRVGSTFVDPGDAQITTISTGNTLSVDIKFLPPIIDLRVNNSNGPLTVEAPASFSLSWDTSSANCTKSGSWSGSVIGSTQQINDMGVGSYTYFLTCTNPAGSASDSVTVNVVDPTVLPGVVMTVDGATTTIARVAPAWYSVAWTANHASYGCLNSGDWGGTATTSFSQFFQNMPVGAYTYTVTCSNPVGSTQKSIAVNVVNPPIVIISAPLDASSVTGIVPIEIGVGDISLIQWASAYVDNNFLTNFPGFPINTNKINWDTTAVTNGSHTLTVQYQYMGGMPTFTAPVIVTVYNIPPVPTVTFSASPSSIISGQSSTLSWSSTDTTSCTASNGWSGTKALSGSESVFPTTTATYTLSCTGSGGTASSSATVAVTLPPSATTNPATSVVTSSATLNGTANPNSASTSAWFRYAITNPGLCNDAFGTRVPLTGGTDLGSGSAAIAYSQPVAGLAASTTYYYCAIAKNSAGYGYGSITAFTTAPDTALPATAITYPVNGATITKQSTLTITASASDNVGVARVEFYANSTLICTDTTYPYSCAWNVPGAAKRIYTLQTKAYDAAGNIGSSAQVTVTTK